MRAALETGECDVALVPVAACAAHPEWEVVPEVGIGCRGPVHSVLLVSAVPLPQIERIYLDAASRTSVVLVQLLLRAQGISPECVHAPHREGAGLVRGTHAALVIGDAAMALHDRFPHVFDLGAMWLAQTGLPFVFAVWAARPGLLTPAHVTALQDARAYGLKHAEELAHAFREQQLQAGLPARDLLSDNAYANYLRRAIRYGLSTKEREGVVEFLSRATAAGLLTIPGHDPEDPVHIRFAGGAAPEALVAARRPRPPLAADELLARAAAGGRLDLAEGIFLYEHADLMALGAAADARRAALHPEGVVTYIIDRNVNYTNVCVTRCKFCNFTPRPAAAAATS
ncbi:MqnA/MqnD/SBP family protein [Nannocystis pusilla]|uniref:menaquinone biosynthetic enzyme MqnA/MqnD family protein n=1 Tax=Nannocystis pusilla TaxID=889268 RepID=UPI003B832658